MAEANAVTPPLQTAAAAQEKAKLRKVLSRIDLVLFTACAILGGRDHHRGVRGDHRRHPALAALITFCRAWAPSVP
jgi:hypothetical protein